MGILRIEHLKKAYGIKEIFHDVSFDVLMKDKIGLIGANGAGKTTLMRCLMGLEEVDGGQMRLDASDRIGYVEQEMKWNDGTLWEELNRSFSDLQDWKRKMETLEQKISKEENKAVLEAFMKEYAAVVDKFERAGGYDYESEIRRVSRGLGFGEADLKKPVQCFSGGQKTRIGLAKALLRQPDFLFLDEPTNHLDIEMVEWLEDFLTAYRGGVLLISHDRFFLDRVVNRILELENKTVSSYDGNYSRYLSLKGERLAALENAYKKQQTYIAKTEEYIRRYKAGIKSKQARGREKQLNRLERIVLPSNSIGFNYFAFHPPGECAKRVAELEDVSAVYGETVIFKKVSLLIRNGDGVALIGPNGTGKTTLLKILVGEMEAQEGRIKLGSRVQIGYFSQQHEGLNLKNNLLNELVYAYDLTEEQARQYLGAFLFRGDDVYKIIGDLSGGEKARAAFLKLMLTGANFLVLDEPTNHLDIPAREAVEEALMAFPGTFLAVSHDRYFLDKVTNCTVELSGGILREYNGNYSYYREKKAAEEKEDIQSSKNASVKAKEDKKSMEKAKNESKVRVLTQAEQAKLAQKYEGEIAMLEFELKGLELQLNHPESHADLENSQALAKEYQRVEKELAEKYDLWAALNI